VIARRRARALAACGLVAAVAVAGAGCSELGPASPWVDAADITGTMAPEIAAPPTIAVAPPTLRVVSWNVNKGANVEGLVAAIRGNPALAGADVFLLQEIESHPDEGGSRAARLATALGLGCAYAPERRSGAGTHGTAILSRWPLSHVQVMELPYSDLALSDVPRIAVRADVQVGGTTVTLMDMHLDTRLNATERILQLRPAVIDAPVATVVGGDFNTNPFLWSPEGDLPLSAETAVDSDQAPVLDDYMRHLDFQTPTAALGPTEQFVGVIDARLDSIYARGVTARPGAVERSIGLSDHWPLWIDVAAP
jgi:endonuclease/exonuclease/phosphatase family metal-dependent hydrolase